MEHNQVDQIRRKPSFTPKIVCFIRIQTTQDKDIDRNDIAYFSFKKVETR